MSHLKHLDKQSTKHPHHFIHCKKEDRVYVLTLRQTCHWKSPSKFHSAERERREDVFLPSDKQSTEKRLPQLTPLKREDGECLFTLSDTTKHAFHNPNHCKREEFLLHSNKQTTEHAFHSLICCKGEDRHCITILRQTNH